MKIRNAILALGLAIVMSFGFTTNLNANTADVPAIEDGINTIIDKLIIESSTLIIRIESSSMTQLSLVAPNGQTVWHLKTTDEIVTVPTLGYASGTYILVAKNKRETQFLSVQVSGSNISNHPTTLNTQN